MSELTIDGLIRDARLLLKQGPPGPPPRPGLRWNAQSHRWVRPEESQHTSESATSSMNDKEKLRALRKEDINNAIVNVRQEFKSASEKNVSRERGELVEYVMQNSKYPRPIAEAVYSLITAEWRTQYEVSKLLRDRGWQ